MARSTIAPGDATVKLFHRVRAACGKSRGGALRGWDGVLGTFDVLADRSIAVTLSRVATQRVQEELAAREEEFDVVEGALRAAGCEKLLVYMTYR